MLGPYVALLRTPGALGFSATGFVARLPISMVGLSIVLLVSAQSGNYKIAGTVSATCSVAVAFGCPRIGRLVDRHGQARVALPATCVVVAAGLALVACADVHAPRWTLYAAAAGVGGALPSIGSLVRARWSALLGRSPSLSTAFSLESTIDELVFIVGPILATALATGLAPSAGLLAALGFALFGTAALTAQRSTEPPPTLPMVHRGRGLLRSPGMVPLTLASACLGGLFGSVEIVTVAFAADQHHRGAAGLVLACFALGSGFAGVLTGSRQIAMPLHRRYLIGMAALAAVMTPLLAVHGLVELAAMVFVAGFTVSPTLISGVGLVQTLVPAAQLTEGFAWLSAGMSLGGTLGSSLGGWAADALGTPTAYVVPVGCGALGVLVVFAGMPSLRAPRAAGLVPGARAGREIEQTR